MRGLLTLLFSVFCFKAVFAGEVLIYTIKDKESQPLTEVEMRSQDRYLGSLIKNHFLKLRTSYDLYDSIGNYEAQGVCRIFSIGAVYVWAKEIDIYDQEGKKLGMIDGQAWTAANARFGIYDRKDNLIGIACLDCKNSSFTILDPANNRQVVAQLKRNFAHNAADYWDVILYDTSSFDARILKIFSAFAIDFQEYFREDK